MRILHLYFQLHLPYQLNLTGEHKMDLFHDAAAFANANETEYQPFFALLERNSQKFSNFKISLGISGQWFEQAEKHDPGLIQRLKKLINLGHVQIIALPFDYSLAWFYDQDEFEAQIKLFNHRIRDYFGLECSVFAMPELIYNDKIAIWAEKAGYSGMIIGDAESVLDWRTPNRIYEAKNCKDLRLVCQNTKFSRAIIDGQDILQTFNDKDNLNVFSLPKFQKELDLEFLHGNLVNLCLDTSIFRRLKGQGIIKFFDGFIAEWLTGSQNRFYNALETIGSSQPKNEISVKSTIMRHNTPTQSTDAIVLLKKIRYAVPSGLNNVVQVKFEETLYSLRDQVLSTKDDQIIRDFERLTALDYITDQNRSENTVIKMPSISELSEILVNFGQKVFSMMPRPAKLAETAGLGRADLPKAERGFEVKINRVKTRSLTKNTKSGLTEDRKISDDPINPESPNSTRQRSTKLEGITADLPSDGGIKIHTDSSDRLDPDTVFGNISFDGLENIKDSVSNTGIGHEERNAPIRTADEAAHINEKEEEDPRRTENAEKIISVQDIEDAALNKHTRVEISLSDLPEAEIVHSDIKERAESDRTSRNAPIRLGKRHRGVHTTKPSNGANTKRSKRRRVIIE